MKMDPISHRPALTREDLRLLQTIVFSESTDIGSLAVDFEFFERNVLTYDQASFGLQRLLDAGLIRVTRSPAGELLFAPTGLGIEIRRAIEGDKADNTQTLTQRLATAIRERAGVPSRVRKPSRLQDLDEAGFELAVSPQHAWREKVPPEVLERLLPGLSSRDIRRR